MRGSWSVLAGSLGVVLSIALLACSESGDERVQMRGARQVAEHNEPRARPVQWKLVREPQGSRISVAMEVDYCVGGEPPDPELGKVKVERQRQGTIMTVFPSRKGAPKRGVGCAGLEVPFYARVILPMASKGDDLFDGSVKPPVRRWPGGDLALSPKSGLIDENEARCRVELGKAGRKVVCQVGSS